MQSETGKAKENHEAKSTVPARISCAASTLLGAVPMGVAMPPTVAAYTRDVNGYDGAQVNADAILAHLAAHEPEHPPAGQPSPATTIRRRHHEARRGLRPLGQRHRQRARAAHAHRELLVLHLRLSTSMRGNRRQLGNLRAGPSGMSLLFFWCVVSVSWCFLK